MRHFATSSCHFAFVCTATLTIFVVASLAAPRLLSQGGDEPRAGQMPPEGPQPVIPEIVEEDAEPPPADWTVPEAYRGTIVRKRLRYFKPKLLALTFDDGPDPDVTPRVLALLKKYNARATFFLIGKYVSRHPQLARQIADEGHAIGNHTYDHPKEPSRSEAFTELDKAASEIETATGRKSALFRPPYGIARSQSVAEALRRGWTAFLWTISSADTSSTDPRTIASNVIHTPNPGDIVILHDGPGHGYSAAALEMVLKELSEKGWKFVTLPELLQAWEAERKARIPDSEKR